MTRFIPLLLLAAILPAQPADPKLALEVAAVRAHVARSNDALRQYTWTEHTEVSVGGDVKSSTALICRYDESGALTKTPVGDSKDDQKKPPSAVSKRHTVRKKADLQDYIDRSISRVRVYVPPKPETMQYLLQSGQVSLGQSEPSKWELRFTHYHEPGDLLVFTYDTVSKVLLRVNVKSTLGSPKDPVTLVALFEPLPDGINHAASAVLIAKKKNIQVKVWNDNYQKVAN